MPIRSMRMSFLTNFYNLLAILAFIGSAGLYLKAFLDSRRKVSLSVNDYKRYDDIGVVQFFVLLQNNSSKPLCISSIAIKQPSDIQTCELIPKPIRGIEPNMIKTPWFPLNLSPHEGVLHYLEFLYCEDIELGRDKTVAFQIHTNRGMVEKAVTLGNISYYLHTKEEFERSQLEGK